MGGNILPFKKEVYSSDAMEGIYVPGNAKAEINKDATMMRIYRSVFSIPWSPALINGMNALPFVKASLILLMKIHPSVFRHSRNVLIATTR